MSHDHPLQSHIDALMAAAEREGVFDNLPGAGKPLKHLDTPKDAVLDTVLREAQAKPLAVTLKAQIAEAQAVLKAAEGEDARRAAMKVLADLQMRLAIELEARGRYG